MMALNALFPVFSLILLGWFLRRKSLLSAETTGQMTGLLYWYGMPALLFVKFASLESLTIDISNYFLSFLMATFSAVALGYLFAGIMGLGRVKIGAFVQASFRGNLAFVGLPIALYYLSEVNLPALEGMIFLALSPMIITYNLLGVALLVLHGERASGQIKKGVARILTNPLILSCALGIGFRWQGWSLPGVLEQALTILGQMVVPLSLILVGASVEFASKEPQGAASYWAAFLKTFFTPWAGFGFATLFGLAPEGRALLMLFLAAPTAAAAYILAQQLGSDAKMTANAILLGSFSSLASVSWIFFLLL